MEEKEALIATTILNLNSIKEDLEKCNIFINDISTSNYSKLEMGFRLGLLKCSLSDISNLINNAIENIKIEK